MSKNLSTKKIAFLATDGFEQVELTSPWEALKDQGAEVILISLESGKIDGYHHKDKGDSFDVDVSVHDASVSDYDALVLPGGVHNPDALRLDNKAIKFVQEFAHQNKPIAAICHGPWVLVEAGLVDHKTLTSWPSVKTDIKNAGGQWVDEKVVLDNGLITSRKPDDLEAFNNALIDTLKSQKNQKDAA